MHHLPEDARSDPTTPLKATWLLYSFLFKASILQHLPVDGGYDVGLQVVHAPPGLGLVEGKRLQRLRRRLEVELGQNGLSLSAKNTMLVYFFVCLPGDERAGSVSVVLGRGLLSLHDQAEVGLDLAQLSGHRGRRLGRRHARAVADAEDVMKPRK